MESIAEAKKAAYIDFVYRWFFPLLPPVRYFMTEFVGSNWAWLTIEKPTGAPVEDPRTVVSSSHTVLTTAGASDAGAGSGAGSGTEAVTETVERT